MRTRVRRPARITAAGVLTAVAGLLLAAAPASAVGLADGTGGLAAVNIPGPVDDWIGDGVKELGDVALGGLEITGEAIAKLLATLVVALADLLVPKSLVRAGVDGIRWLVQLPPVGSVDAGKPGIRDAHTPGSGGSLATPMPHVVELRSTLSWIGITLLPLGLVISGGRAIVAPSQHSPSLSEVLLRCIGAGFGLIVYDWAWGLLVRLSRLLTEALLGLPWVAEGTQKMLKTLVIAGASGGAVAAEFVIPLILAVAGMALLAVLLLRVGLEIIAVLLYVTGGLVLGVSPTEFGRRVAVGWAIACGSILILPVLWTTVFVTGAALMLDAPTATGSSTGGFAKFAAQLWNVAAALGVFAICIVLAKGLMKRATGAMAGLAGGPPPHTGRLPTPRPGGGTGATRPTRLEQFGQGLRAIPVRAARHAGAGTVRAGSTPLRHPSFTEAQATRGPADALRARIGQAGHHAARLADTIAPPARKSGRRSPAARRDKSASAATWQRPARAGAGVARGPGTVRIPAPAAPPAAAAQDTAPDQATERRQRRRRMWPPSAAPVSGSARALAVVRSVRGASTPRAGDAWQAVLAARPQRPPTGPKRKRKGGGG